MMRMSLIFIGIILFVPIASAQMVTNDAVEKCKAMYPLPTLSINSNVESTGHDPRQFLIRRCISNERKKIINNRRASRQLIRDAAHFDRSAAQTNRLRIRSENYLQDAIRRQNLKRRRFRSRTNLIDADIFREGRRSRRMIIRDAEGIDRINAIRRTMRAKNLPDPCLSIAAIRQFNNPCRNYGRVRGMWRSTKY